MPAASETPTHPGADLGLPASGRGSLASWGSRVGALLIDWGASMVVAIALFGIGVMREGGWKAWMTMAVFFVQKTLLTTFASGSFGQLITRIAVVKVGGGVIGFWRAAVRTAMICLVFPAVILGPNRRALDDVLLNTVVINRASRKTP
ncbi:MAG TPA: RDD family protein [Propionibacteriaceae bacterium]|nr:RDD family protein [Propionibacteriaceae bacterium]